MTVRVSDETLAAIYAHARAEFPRECCGYLRGEEVVQCRNAQEDGEHPTHPTRGAETGYVIAGRELFEFARAFQTDRPPTVVYHSHSNGRAYFSDVDRMNAAPGGVPAYPVLHLVIGVTAEAVKEAAIFGWSDEERDFVELHRFC